jgi:Xaa-Pro aminopeptidase
MGLHTYGSMGVDWEERVRFDRLREERLARIKSLLAASELGALLCFDMANIRYVTATHIGTWAQDKLNRFCLLPQGDEPIMWDFGSAARHHQLYNPWLGDGRSRAGISTLRGAMSPQAGRAEDVAKKIRRELEERDLLGEPVGVDALEPPVLFALQAEGIDVVDGQQLLQDARVIKTQDEVTLLNTASMMVDAAYEELYREMRPGMRENECVGLVNKVLYDMGSEFVEGVNAISGERCNPHPHVYTDRSLRPGDPAYFDILHSFMGYRTCYYRTFAVGSASRSLVDAYKRCRYYLDAAIALIRPGATTAEVVQVWPRADEFGFADEEAAFALQFGHGVGLAIWEKPIFSRLVSLDHPEEIREGMVFALETFWPASDGWSAARIEEELVVTADGCEVITRFPAEDLVVAGRPYYTPGGTLPLERESQSNLNTRLDAATREASPAKAGPSRDGDTAGPATRLPTGDAGASTVR